MVPENNRICYRCDAWDKAVWVVKEMSAYTEFPACVSSVRNSVSQDDMDCLNKS